MPSGSFYQAICILKSRALSRRYQRHFSGEDIPGMRYTSCDGSLLWFGGFSRAFGSGWNRAFSLTSCTVSFNVPRASASSSGKWD